VYSNEKLPEMSGPEARVGHIRRQVVEAAGDIMRGNKDASTGSSYVESVHDVRFPAEPSDHAAMDLYLALLQDRLPVYVHTLADLVACCGHGSVEDNLLPAATATIDFYREILGAKVSVFTRPTQLVRLREVMRSRRLGPSAAEDRVARYLEEEQGLGRIAPDVAALAAARLLLGACVSYAFTAMLMGEENMPPRDEYVADAIRALRLHA
jgi:hypothetical protein